MFSQTRTFARTAFSLAGAALFATTCLVASVAPAAASAVSTTVSTADLNLAHPKGRAALDGRIKAAAKAVCNFGGGDSATRRAEARCVREAIASRK